VRQGNKWELVGIGQSLGLVEPDSAITENFYWLNIIQDVATVLPHFASSKIVYDYKKL
jgi:hypothetical protein